MSKIIDARVNWGDDWDNMPELEVLVDREPKYEVYEKRSVSGDQLSDEQLAIVGATHNKPTTLYRSRDEDCVWMFTWEGKPDNGFGRYRRTIKLSDGTEEEVVGGWMGSASLSERAGLEPVIGARIFHDRVSWVRGHTASAGFVLQDAALAVLAKKRPHVEPVKFDLGGYSVVSFKIANAPYKHEWRKAERERVHSEQTALLGREPKTDDWLPGGALHRRNDDVPKIRPYSSLLPVEPARSQDQVVSDMEMDRQAAREGYNPNR